jgi:hypothetical protein
LEEPVEDGLGEALLFLRGEDGLPPRKAILGVPLELLVEEAPGEGLLVVTIEQAPADLCGAGLGGELAGNGSP